MTSPTNLPGPRGIARCGCGAYGSVVEIDDQRTSSVDYTFTIETQNGDRHLVHALYDREDELYRMRHLR